MIRFSHKILIISLSVLPIIFGIIFTAAFTGQSVEDVIGVNSVGLDRLSVALMFISVTTTFIFGSYIALTLLVYFNIARLNQLINDNKEKRIKGSNFIPQSALGLIAVYLLFVFIIMST